jgi:site-specific recombinase XerD
VPAAKLFEKSAGPDEASVWSGFSSAGLTSEALGSQLLCAAHDAGLERIHEISADAVRHTYIAFLVRQGARFADIVRLVGPLDAALLPAYSELAPSGVRLDAAAIEPDFPAVALLRRDDPDGHTAG